jgi:enoyl-CoA hydratase/carnithine racemase
MAVPAAAAAAAAGLRVRVNGPLATLWVRGDTGPGSLGVLGHGLDDALRRLTGDVRVAVIRVGDRDPRPPGGVGEGCPADQVDPGGLADECPAWRAALARLAAHTDLLTVAAVSGSTADVGLALAVACDLRLFAADAVFHPDFARAGLLPVPGGLTRLAALMGWSGVLDVMLTGRPLGAAEAARLGLAQRVVPGSRLEGELDALVADLLTASRDLTAELKALSRVAAPGAGAIAAGRALDMDAARVGPEAEAWERLAAAARVTAHDAAG